MNTESILRKKIELYMVSLRDHFRWNGAKFLQELKMLLEAPGLMLY